MGYAHTFTFEGCLVLFVSYRINFDVHHSDTVTEGLYRI